MRSIEGKLLPTLLSRGIDQSGGTRGGAPGSLEYVINGRIQTAGRIQPRCGTSAIAALSKGGGGSRAYADSSAIPRPTERPSFATYVSGEKLLGTTAGDLYAYDGTFFDFRGCFSSSRPVRRSTALAESSYIGSMPGTVPAVAATSDGYRLVAASRLNQVIWTITDPDGIVLYRGEGVTITANSWPRAVVQGTKLILVYQDGTALNALSHETSTGVIVATGPTSVLTLNSSASLYWDASSYNSSQWYVVGRVGATSVNVGIVDTVTAGTTTTIVTTGEVALSVWADATNAQIWVGYLDDPSGTPTAGFTVLAASLLATVYAKTTILASPSVNLNAMPPLFGPRYSRAGADSDAFYVLWAGLTTATIRYGHVVAGTVTPSTPHSVFHVLPLSKPDAQQRFWVLSYGATTSIGQALLLRYAEPPGSSSPTLTIDLSAPLDGAHANALPLGSFHAAAVQSEAAGASTFFGIPTVVATAEGGSGVQTQIAAMVYEYRRYNQEPTVAVAIGSGEVILAGQPTTTLGVGAHAGNLTYYGGVGAVEIGFPLVPWISATPSAPGNLPVGSYIYQTVQQWVDDAGNRHLSAPSDPVTVTITVPADVTISGSDFALGQRNVGSTQRADTLLFRTVVGGQVPQFTGNARGPTATGLIAINDAMDDASLATNEFLPTAGGILPPRLAPACRYVRAAEERLWCGGLWDRNLLEASRIRVPGEPYQFTQDASHQVVLPGDCNGIAYQDGQIVAFCDDGIYLIGGDGPNDQGAGAFLPPRALVRGLGCTEAESASILETELGIIFRSPSSWWLIPRGFGAPVDIGGVIQGETNTHCIASAITETSSYRLARFLVSTAGQYSSDTVLTFDLMNQQWFRDVYTGAAFGTIGAWPDGLALCQYSLARTGAGAVSNVIWAEDEDLLSDAAASPIYIPLSFRQNWQYPFGPGGWGRANRVQLAMEPLDGGGAVVRSDTLTITVETDQVSVAPAWTLTANSSSGPMYREAVPTKPACTCYRTTVHVVQTSGTALPGLRLLSLTTEIGPDGQELGIRPLTNAERS